MNLRTSRLTPWARFHRCPRASNFESRSSFRGMIPWMTILASSWYSKIRLATFRTLALTNRSVHFFTYRSLPPTAMNHSLGRRFACLMPFSQCQRRFGPVSPELPRATAVNFDPLFRSKVRSKYSSIPSSISLPRSRDPLSCSISPSPKKTMSRSLGAFLAWLTMRSWLLFHRLSSSRASGFSGSGHTHRSSTAFRLSSKHLASRGPFGSSMLLYSSQWMILDSFRSSL
mmetsp:Transcript_15228/g.35297  ORF Transcript_15228/g.35297 Transcript_15228/m.35297 type:complete len:229 (-) Transcript_15228:583-1269(-)